MKIIIHTISTEDFDRLRECIGKRLLSVERPDECDYGTDAAVIEIETMCKPLKVGGVGPPSGQPQM
ncbi:hypothetical protein [Gimesia maris]|uniref:hypothetical protein n=1 Tax=Gimesia maris TaxID=122 RepID=UPI0032F00101